MSVEEIGCCGAYCKTCKAYQRTCKGCKIGYANGARDLSKAKCKIKVCCLNKGYASCAECANGDTCTVVQEFHNHKGYKYSRYKQAAAYIKDHGYAAFLERADTWKNAYGKD